MPDPTVLLDRLEFGESLRWHDDRLWIANWGKAEIVAVDINGLSEIRREVPTTFPFSIDWLPDGRLLVIAGREAVLLRRETDGSLVTHADLSPFGSVFNELVVEGRGYSYVNGGGSDPMTDQAFAPGLVVLVTPDGSAREVAEGIDFGNGMAVTPDNRTLIVAESYGNQLSAFDIAEDGSLSGRRVWANLGQGVPDGICLDAGGAVWYADVPAMRCVRVAEGGRVLETVQLDRGAFSCMLGGADGQSLFIAASIWRGMEHMMDEEHNGQVLIVDVTTPHVGWP